MRLADERASLSLIHDILGLSYGNPHYASAGKRPAARAVRFLSCLPQIVHASPPRVGGAIPLYLSCR